VLVVVSFTNAKEIPQLGIESVCEIGGMSIAQRTALLLNMVETEIKHQNTVHGVQ
jgi:tRNA A37 threonylcarbamoyltransferase TsaD